MGGDGGQRRGEGGRGGTPVPVSIPVVAETQIEYTEWSDTLRVLLQYELEYIALSSALRLVLPLMTMMEEIDKVFSQLISKPNCFCKFHEGNQSCIQMTTGTNVSPRTKHIALKYHHFRSYVKYGRVYIHYIATGEQLADLLTKSLSNKVFFTLRYMLCGWGYG